MAVEVTINGITGTSPYDLYICQPNGTGCFYISTVTQTQINAGYDFFIPEPYDNGSAYMLKVIDSQNCIISGVTFVS